MISSAHSRAQRFPSGVLTFLLISVFGPLTANFCIANTHSPEFTPGSTQSQLTVSQDGSIAYSIPIVTPPGTGSIEPKVSLSYNSRGGPSPYGFGWSVSGLSVIQRGPRNIAEDGVVRGVALDKDDALYLDGEKLIQVTSEDAGSKEFRTRVENYTRIRAYEWSEEGPKRIIVETRSGLKMYFGTTDASRARLAAGGAIATWLCDRIEDSAGNFMLFSYIIDGLGHRISQIAYTGNEQAKIDPYAKINFTYREMKPYEAKYALGVRIEQNSELQSIVTSFDGKTLREYTPSFDLPDEFRHAKRLIELKESGSDGIAYRPLRFLYSSAAGGWNSETAKLPDDVLGVLGKNRFEFSNVQGSESQELLFRFSAGGELKSGAYDFSSGSPVLLDKKWFPPVDLTWDNYLITDLNSDGYSDLLISGQTSYLSDPGKGWTPISNNGLGFDLAPNAKRDNRFVLANVSIGGARKRVMLWSSPKQALSAGASWLSVDKWVSESKFTPPRPFQTDPSEILNGVYALDADCDGSEELLYNLQEKNGLHVRETYRFTPNGWALIGDPSYLLPFSPLPHSAAIKIADLNSDGCKDIVVAYRDGEFLLQKAWIASTSGWREDPRPLPNTVFWVGTSGTEGRLLADLVDLDRDGRPDIFWGDSDGDTSKAGAYRLTDTDWVGDNSFAPPEAIPASPRARPYSFTVLNLLGSTNSQLAFFKDQSPPNVYSYSLGGWHIDGQLTPPQTIAQFNKADLGVRFPDLNGDGYSDIAFTKKNVKGDELKVAYLFNPGSKKPWTEDVRYRFPRPTFSEDLKDTGTFLFDLNGDGLTDFLYAHKSAKSKNPPIRESYINCSLMPECKSVPENLEGGYWKKATDRIFNDRYNEYVPPIDFAEEGLGSLGVRAIDINGDGLTDLISSREEDAPDDLSPPRLVQHVFLNKISTDPTGRKIGKWSEQQRDDLLPPIAFTRSLRPMIGEKENEYSKIRDNRVELIDLDGDRLPDMVYHYVTASPKPETEEERKIRLADGRPIEFELEIVSGAYLNRYDHWIAAPEFTPKNRLDSDDTDAFEIAKSATQASFQDLNGDGLPDLVYAERCEGNCAPGRKSAINETYINTGSSWLRESNYDIPESALLKNTKGDQGYRLLDVNADGLVDVIYHRVLKGGAREKGAYINTGMGWRESKSTDTPPQKGGYSPPLAFVEVDRGDLGVRPLDLNGDGIVDLVQTYKRSESESASSIWINEPFASPSNRRYKTDLLAEVIDGFDRKSRIIYQSYIGTTFNKGDETLKSSIKSKRAKNTEYPILETPMPGYVATTLEVSGPGVPARTSNYRYGEYRINTLTGKSLGFATQEIRDVDRRRRTTIHYLQQDGLIGNIAKTNIMQTVSSGREIELSSSESRYSISLSPGLPLYNDFTPTIIRSSLNQSKNISRDLVGEMLSGQVDDFEYDENGNPALIKTIFADGSGSETINKYADNLTKWHLARLIESSVTHFAPGKSSQVRRAAFKYSPETGQLSQETSLVGTPYQNTTEYDRDAFGNKISVRNSVEGGEPPRLMHVTYDALGRFPVETTNNLGHKTRKEFDSISGAMTSSVDANGIRESVQYDSLQRIVQEINAAGTVTRTDVGFSKDKSTTFYVSKQTGNLPSTTTFHDAAGRPKREVSTGFNGKPILVEYDYDRLGRLTRTSLPRFTDEQPRYTNRSYDELDRPTEERRPDKTVVFSRYEGLTTIVVDALGHKTATERDIRGRITSTIDSMGGVTKFEFDTSSKTTAIINSLGHVTRAEYDIAGHRVVLDDPALGRWTYKYNGFGELVQQVDARKEVVTLRYDEIGRLIERKSKSNQASYQFDQGNYAIGRLNMVRSSQGSSRSIGYDQFGRVHSVAFQVGMDRARIEQSYDQLGRPLERKYSSGFTVANSYDMYGFWRKVRVSGSEPEHIVWESLNVDASGRVTSEKFGNGVVINQSFDDDTGRFKSGVARNANGASIQDFTLDYDLAGNVVQRTDRLSKRTERYEYDELNRITSATLSPAETILVSYDPLGNILEKSNAGTYRYCDNERTRTLCAVKQKDGMESIFSYDAAGNMVKFGKNRLTFDSEGRVIEVTDGEKNHSKYSYGADGELITQESASGKIRFEVAYLGDSEILREVYAPPYYPTPERTRVRHFITSPTGTLGFFETTYSHFPFRHASPMYGTLLADNPSRSSEVSSGMTYFLRDQLGSLKATLSEQGEVMERFEYDPWGKRRQDKNYTYHSVRKGFTGHEHLDNFELIHMGGRIYSPFLARFVSADPFVQFPGYSQSYNRYSYVLNNPLRFIDPTGYWSIGDAIGGIIRGAGRVVGDIFDAVVGKPLRWVGDQLHKAGNWLQQNWRTVAIIAAAVALGPMAVAAYGPVLGGMISGAAIGALGPALYGGSIDDVLRGAAIGAITGAITGGIAQEFGQQHSFQRVFLEGANGGLGSALRGQRFEEGFKFGALVAALSWANSAMRENQIEKSKGLGVVKDGERQILADNLAEQGELSNGFMGDGYKLGGGRYPEGIDISKPCGADCTFGGWQADTGYLGKSTYTAGSIQDTFIEAYAGPHDWMREYVSRSTLQNGFSASFSGARAAADSAANAALLIPATYFAIPPVAPAAGYEIQSRCGSELQKCR